MPSMNSALNLEQNHCGYLLGVSGTYQVRIGLHPYQVSRVVERIGNWQELSCKQVREKAEYAHWQRVEINSASRIGWSSWLLLRREIQAPSKVSYYLAFGREETSLEELVEVACSRATIQRCFERSKSGLGFDQYEVRSYVGWYRHITLCLVGLLYLEAK